MKTLRDIYAYREMIWSLVRRDLRGRYKGSVLGFLWTFINPLLQLAVYTLVFSFVLRSNIENFYMFLFVALVPWLFFSACLSGGAEAVLGQKEMVKKIYFPREVLPVAHTTSNFVNMLLCMLVIFAVLLISGIGIRMSVLYLPVIMIIQYILCMGVTFLTSSLTVYFRDLEHILGILSMAWMYMTPILYPMDIVPAELQKLYMLNPMTPIILSYRDVLFYGTAPDMFHLLYSLVFSLVVCIVGFAVFERLKRRFVEEM
nr:ABC transporter permease [Maliibacterium massiliense]